MREGVEKPDEKSRRNEVKANSRRRLLYAVRIWKEEIHQIIVQKNFQRSMDHARYIVQMEAY